MKILLLFVLIQIFAYRLAHATEYSQSEMGLELVKQGPTLTEIQLAKLDDCKDLLPKLQSDYANFDSKYRDNSKSQEELSDAYNQSFNQMTAVIFEVTDARNKENAEMVQARAELSDAITKYKTDRANSMSKTMQDSYFNLTSRHFNAVVEAQKNLEKIRTSIADVERTRTEVEKSKMDSEALDHEKLALESQVVSLQIRCSSQRQ